MKRLNYFLLGIMVFLLMAAGTLKFTEDNIKFGDGTDTDKEIVANVGDGATNPFMRYDASENEFVLSHDGTNVSKIASQDLLNQDPMKFYEQTGNGTNFIGLSAPDAVTADKTFKLPDGDGTVGQVLKTDGALNLGWVSALSNPSTVDVTINEVGGSPKFSANDTNLSIETVLQVDTASSAGFVGNVTNHPLNIGFNNTDKITLKTDDKVDFVGTITVDNVTNRSGNSGITTSVGPTGGTVLMTLENTDNTNGSSDARMKIASGGASSGDALLQLTNSVANWYLGLDNGNADQLRISTNSDLSSAAIQVTTAGGVTINETGGNSGNVPHRCSRDSDSIASATAVSLDCEAGEILVGGGCNCSDQPIRSNYPLDGNTWQCRTTATCTALNVYTICCDY